MQKQSSLYYIWGCKLTPAIQRSGITPSKWKVSKGITGAPPGIGRGIYEAAAVLSKLQRGKSSNSTTFGFIFRIKRKGCVHYARIKKKKGPNFNDQHRECIYYANVFITCK